ITPAQLQVIRNGTFIGHNTDTNLYITDGVTGDKIVLDNFLSANTWGPQSVQFADGTSWTRAQLLAQVEILGSSGVNYLYGTAAHDTIDGKGGGDVVNGGGGYDTYIMDRGYGNLTINNLASDGSIPKGEIDFTSQVAHDQLWFQHAGNDLKIDILGTHDVVT